MAGRDNVVDLWRASRADAAVRFLDALRADLENAFLKLGVHTRTAAVARLPRLAAAKHD